MSIHVSEEELLRMTELFRAVSDRTRLKILLLLAQQEFCVTELAEIMDMTQSAISHQLGILKAQRLVSSRRDGKLIYYKATEKILSIIREYRTCRSEAPPSC